MRSFSLGWLLSGERDVEHLLIRCDLWGLGCTIFVCSWSTCCRHAERLLSQAVDTQALLLLRMPCISHQKASCTYM